MVKELVLPDAMFGRLAAYGDACRGSVPVQDADSAPDSEVRHTNADLYAYSLGFTDVDSDTEPECDCIHAHPHSDLDCPCRRR